MACRIYDMEPKYYADGEDAFAMRRNLRKGVLQQDADKPTTSTEKTTDSQPQEQAA